jgi:hypothetical protein
MFIGAKMLLSMKYQIPTWVTLAVIAGVLGLSVMASLLFPKNNPPGAEEKRG